MKEQGPSVRIHLGFRPNLAISSPEAFEKILSSNTHITKVKNIFFKYCYKYRNKLMSALENIQHQANSTTDKILSARSFRPGIRDGKIRIRVSE